MLTQQWTLKSVGGCMYAVAYTSGADWREARADKAKRCARKWGTAVDVYRKGSRVAAFRVTLSEAEAAYAAAHSWPGVFQPIAEGAKHGAP